MSKSVLQLPVIERAEAARQVVRLTLQAPEWARAARAGHFINLLVPGRRDLLWRRPFSVHRADRSRGTIDLLVARMGRGSESLAECAPGDHLDAIGLLGNCFPFDPGLHEIIMVAGGIGIAPFDLLLQDVQGFSCKKSLFYGARSAGDLCRSTLWAESGAEVHLTTEDGSTGSRGLVLDELRRYLGSSANHAGRVIYGCGPTPMLAALREMALALGIKGYVTVENRMACGFGACVGCAVELAEARRDGQKYLLACKDGPVFPIEEILFHD
ncbi:MAG: Dihydroorotate dehydrogenase B (NAD(+)), electron transfer subunit [bacterium ADurb.Bin431]|nr:MAG: Dihydroorotate dehydrogenase B (NAD(+)), electron transfer subunit [bacterium ADurb.Bin431]HNY90486.1 dihydroorotate dehydrogenase electron transfer subunit [bacterium]HOH07294.1 dihydroorotate dehydrogenase electron transfer subunit [bacterium]